MKDPSELAADIAERRASLLDRLARHERGESFEQLRQEVDHAMAGFLRLVTRRSERIAELEAAVDDAEDRILGLQCERDNGKDLVQDACKRIAELEAEVKEREHHSGLQDEFIHSLTGRAEAAEAELAQLREANRWIPVEERLPDTDCAVALWDADHKTLRLGEYSSVVASGRRSWATYGTDIPGRLTHWRPLPEGPEA